MNIKKMLENLALTQNKFLEEKEYLESIQKDIDNQVIEIQKYAQSCLDVKQPDGIRYFNFVFGTNGQIKIKSCSKTDDGTIMSIHDGIYYTLLPNYFVQELKDLLIAFDSVPTPMDFINNMPMYFLNHTLNVPWISVAFIKFKNTNGTVMYVPSFVLDELEGA